MNYVISSPLGAIELDISEDGLTALRFTKAARTKAAAAAPNARAKIIISALEAYFSGDLSKLDEIKVAPRGTEFQQKVWTALRKIPAGTTTSYAELAARIGNPKAVRAVARANATNPIALVVPCHRVIGSDGQLRGYAYGLEAKRWLLDHERR